MTDKEINDKVKEMERKGYYFPFVFQDYILCNGTYTTGLYFSHPTELPYYFKVYEGPDKDRREDVKKELLNYISQFYEDMR